MRHNVKIAKLATLEDVRIRATLAWCLGSDLFALVSLFSAQQKWRRYSKLEEWLTNFFCNRIFLGIFCLYYTVDRGETDNEGRERGSSDPWPGSTWGCCSYVVWALTTGLSGAPVNLPLKERFMKISMKCVLYIVWNWKTACCVPTVIPYYVSCCQYLTITPNRSSTIYKSNNVGIWGPSMLLKR